MKKILVVLALIILYSSLSYAAWKSDVNGDGDVDLRDVVNSLQVVAGVEPVEVKNSEADVNNDGAIGLEEAIFAMQVIADMRAYTDTFGLTFKRIEAGTFTMGSPGTEIGRKTDEKQHEVTIARAFYIQETEMTQAQWEAVRQNNLNIVENPSFFSDCLNCPVESVLWEDLQDFIIWMNEGEIGNYSLPTEAEWEYAARAGSQTAFAKGNNTQSSYICNSEPNLNAMGWYCYNSSSKTHPVKGKAANAWGLFDMHGNVWEWCSDTYEVYPTDLVTTTTGLLNRVIRGGGWFNTSQHCRSANRVEYVSGRSDYLVGFRLVWSPPSKPGIEIHSNENIIVDGDNVPSETDNTDFGGTEVAGGAPIVHTFTIINTGNEDLELTGTPPVVVSGSHKSDFTVNVDILTTIVPVGGTTTFVVTFVPGGIGLRNATLTIANNSLYENPYNFTIAGTGTAPEMEIYGNNILVADGATAPNIDDHTDFGSAAVTDATVVRTFTVQNTGDADLDLTGTEIVSITGDHASDFSISSAPTTPVTPAGTITFEITFDPGAEGQRNAFVSIPNNDSDENPYDFAISGTGIVPRPEMEVLGNSITIADGAAIPNIEDHTDFGSAAVTDGTVVRTFTIQNTGDADLDLTGTDILSITGDHASDFSISLAPTTPVAPAGTITFEITFDPGAEGQRNAFVSISNNDPNVSPYDFAISGTGSI